MKSSGPHVLEVAAEEAVLYGQWEVSDFGVEALQRVATALDVGEV